MNTHHLHNFFHVGALSILAAASIALPSGAALSADGCKVDTNCIPNASFVEITDPLKGTPDNWRTNVFGKSDAAFTITAGRSDGAAATVAVTSHDAPADAKWVFDETPVVGGQYFTFSDWYKSEGNSEVYVFFRGGTTPYVRLTGVPPSATPDTWTELQMPGFFVPAGATAMTVSHILVGDGSLTTDDYSLILKPAPAFRQGLVSLTFDDGWKSVYVNAIPILNRAGLKSTQYINTDPVVLNPDRYARNITLDNLLSMQSQGHEIGAHTRSHRDLVDDIKGDDERRAEVDGSRSDLLGAGIATVDTFAYTFGKHDDRLREIVGNHFVAARTTDLGFNTTDVDRLALKSQLVLNTTTPAEVREWTDYALANNLWLVLTIHRVELTLADCVQPVTGETDHSCTDTATLQAIVDYLRGLPTGTVKTVHEVLSDDSLWTPPDAPSDVSTTPKGDGRATGSYDPPSTYTGQQASLEYTMNVAYAAGFRTEEQLLAAVGIAIGESDLWTSARNWHPEKGFRDPGDVIGVHGPLSAWSSDGRQMHSDRGLFQISTYWWPKFTDELSDNPATAAAAFFDLSSKGTDFSIWDSFRSGRAQGHFDSHSKGWPALRPLVQDFLNRAVPPEEVLVSENTASPEETPAVEASTTDATAEAPAVAPVELAENAAAPEATPVPPPLSLDRTSTDPAESALEQAARVGNSWAKIGLAEALLDGSPKVADAERAVALLREAADGGLEGPALGTLGIYYRSIGDYENALVALEQASAADNIWAQFRLADMLIKGEGVAANPDRAVELLRQASQKGLKGPASKRLAAYYRGIGDDTLMVASLSAAVDAGDAEAKLLLGQALMKGDHVAADPERAVALLEDAAEAGLKGPASKFLADYYLATGSSEKALAAFEAASDAGDIESTFRLGIILLKGDGAPADPERAVALLEEVASGPAFNAIGLYYRGAGDNEKALVALDKAAEAGEAEAKLVLGEMLITGDGTDADPERAIALLEDAAEGGFVARASGALGKYYRTAGDAEKAIAAFDAASTAGVVEAKLALGEMLLKGEGATADPARAIPLLEEAAEALSSGPAFSMLGNYYYAAGDKERAFAALDKAVEAGEVLPKLLLGQMLIKGEGTTTDPERAIVLLNDAASAGEPGPAFMTLADYYRGIGDDSEALKALDQAANAGETRAKLLLGNALIVGEDKERAVALLTEAAGDSAIRGAAYSALGGYYRGIGAYEQAAEVLQQAADAGDVQAKLVLGEMLLNGEGISVDRDKARIYLEGALAEGRVSEAYLGLVELAAAEYRNGDSLDLALSLLGQAREVDAGLALNSFERLEVYEKTAMVQAILRQQDIYTGPTNGKLSTSTMKAISKFCSLKGIKECKNEAMPVALLDVLIDQLNAGT